MLARAAKFSALLLALVCFGVAAAYQYLHDFWYEPVIKDTSQLQLEVQSGESVIGLIRHLNQVGLKSHDLLTRLSLKIFLPEFILKSGEYQFQGALSRADIFQRLNDGVSTQYRVTLVEGKTLQELLSELADTDKLEAPTDAELQTYDWQVLLAAEALELMRESPNPEGWFFPDTYYFAKGESWQSILTRAHERMLQVLFEEWEQRSVDLPYKNAYEVLVMASLIERETGAIDEREDIAGVFVRRLQKGMRLQTDPSVIYGLGDSYKGNLTRKHLRADTPYNTYTRHGLPPTPIAMPGRGAIRAALHPAHGTALYFVARGNGRHYFSDTLEEHQKAVRQYQLNRRSDYRSSP